MNASDYNQSIICINKVYSYFFPVINQSIDSTENISILAMIFGGLIPLLLIFLVLLVKRKLCASSTHENSDSAAFDNNLDVGDTPQKFNSRGGEPKMKIFKEICREDSPSMDELNPDVVPSRGEKNNYLPKNNFFTLTMEIIIATKMFIVTN